MKPIVFGIVGSGEIVRMVAPALKGSPVLRVVGIASRNYSAATSLAAGLGEAIVYSDYRELLSRAEIDAVYIATPPATHATMMVEAIARGKHVICEKPFVLGLAELPVVEAAMATRPDLKIASCSSRFLVCPPVRTARELVRSGALGRIQRVRLCNLMPPPLAVEALPEWKRNRATAGGGLLMDWGVYDVDWLRFVLGESFDPAEILGAIDQWGHEEAALETSFAAEIICRSGATIGWERRSEIGPPAQRVEIRGSKGGVDLPFMPGGSSSVLTRHLPEGDCGSKASEASSPMSGWDTILAFPVVDLAEALVFDRPVSSAPPVQRQIHQLIAAFYRSAESQRSIAID